MCALMCVLDLVPKEAHPKEMQSVYPSPPKAFDVHSGVKFTEHQAHWEGDLLSWGIGGILCSGDARGGGLLPSQQRIPKALLLESLSRDPLFYFNQRRHFLYGDAACGVRFPATD